jgi:hypothetical protein
MRRAWTYFESAADHTECVKLAKYFLGIKAAPSHVEHLARCIHDRIEDELNNLSQQPVEQASDGRWEK